MSEAHFQIGMYVLLTHAKNTRSTISEEQLGRFAASEKARNQNNLKLFMKNGVHYINSFPVISQLG